MARFGRCSISSGNLNVRSGPGSNYSIVFTIAKDEVVTILSGPSGEFYRIQRGSQTGYASSTYMTELYYSNGSTARVSVSSGNVNVRSGPSTSYTAVGSLPNNTGVRVLGTISDWKQIIDENQNVGGYCLGTYITSGSDQGANYGLTLSMIRGGGYSYKLDNKTQSNDIREVQRMLTVWGYSCTQDGIYGGGTVTAVSNFQSANGLGVDGQFGQGTLKKINPNYNISLSDLSGGAVLRYDPTNDYSAVREIQTLLNKHGFSCTVDGIYGNSTVSAVKSFQTSQSLSPDGICGANTYTKLTRGHNYDITLAKIRDGGVSFKEDNITYNRDVQEVQRMLASWGYSCSIDGYYGSSTVNAMKLFQGAKGLTIDGFCGKNTLKKLQPNYGVTRDLILDAKAALQFDPTASYSTVSTMQSLLNARGASVATTGWYNDATVYAAKSFQAARGLTQDGICGKRTYEALEQSTPSGAPNSGITLQLIRSSSSPGYSFKLDLVTYKDDIKYVQLLLNEKGYSCSVTGYYDEDTEDAVKRYQSATGCSSVDGKLGRLTLASLEGSIPEVDPNPDLKRHLRSQGGGLLRLHYLGHRQE